MLRTSVRTGLFLLVVSAMLGCGSDTNNDQGISFRAAQYFGVASNGDAPDCTGAGIGGAYLTFNNQTVAYPPTMALVWVKLENYLSQMFVRVIRSECSYVIPGADPTLVIPEDSFQMSGVVSPTSSSSTGTAASSSGSGSSGSGSSTGTASFLCAPFTVLSANMLEFLSVNQSYLPELPFNIIATCRFYGITSSGDNLTTNDLALTIIAIEKTTATTGDATYTGSGTGGTPSTSSSTTTTG